MILAANEIKLAIEMGEIGIEPFDPDALTPNGIDLKIGPQATFTDLKPLEIVKIDGKEHFLVPPDISILVRTKEYIKLPKTLKGRFSLRSSYARKGFYNSNSEVDAGWQGVLVVELHHHYTENLQKKPLFLPIGERFLHLVFEQITSPAQYTGRFLGQREIVL